MKTGFSVNLNENKFENEQFVMKYKIANTYIDFLIKYVKSLA